MAVSQKCIMIRLKSETKELRTQRDITVFLRFPDEQKILQDS